MLDLAGVRDGTRVLDVASGRGEPSLRAARRVGRSGRVLGVDMEDALLDVARARARDAGLANVEYRAADAETLGDDPPLRAMDAATARWALMGMASPVRALEAIRRALRPGGVLVAALWAERARIPWWRVPREVTERHVALPPVDPDGPCPFRYGDPARITRDFEAAGFTITHVEESEVSVVTASDDAGIARWVRTVLGRMVAGLPTDRAAAWEADLARACTPFREGAGVRLGGVTRLVVARPSPSAGA